MSLNIESDYQTSPGFRQATKFIRFFLMFIYLFFNVSCFFYFSITGYLGGDFPDGEYVADVPLLFLSFFVFIIPSLFLLRFIFPYFENKNVLSYCYYEGVFLDVFVLIVNQFMLYASVKYHVGVLGVGDIDVSDVPKIFFFLNTIFQPIYFVLIYLFYRVGSFSFIYFLNVVLYVLSVVFTAQTGQLLLVFCLLVYKLYAAEYRVRLRYIVSVSIVGILFYPMIRLIKYSIVGGVVQDLDLIDVVTSAVSDNPFQIYVDFLFKSFERFQIIANIQYLLSNSVILPYSYDINVGSNYSFFSSHWLGGYIYNLMGWQSTNIIPPQNFLAYKINGLDSWSSHIGLFGYYYFYGAYSLCIYSFMTFIVYISVWISRKINATNSVVDLNWSLGLILVCHGWFFPFLSYVQALLVFFLLLFSLNVLTSVLNKRVIYNNEFNL